MQKKVISEDVAAKLLSELLWELKPVGQNQTGWENELASVCQNNPSTQANWREGRTMPSLLDGLRLMTHLGEPFAKPLLALTGLHVGLEPSAAEQRLGELEEGIARLVVPIAGKAS